jgi:acetyl esterase
MPLHPQQEAALAATREAGGPPISAMSVEEARAMMQFVGTLSGAGPDLLSVVDGTMPGPDREIPVRAYRDVEDPAGTIVYLHGGGGVIGSVQDFDAVLRKLAKESKLEVIGVDYALAPEAPFPAALNEAWAVVTTLAEREPSKPLVVMGDSSGGGLSAAIAIRARDAGLPLALQVLLYPLVDTDMTTASYAEFAETDYINNRADLVWFLSHYAPDPATHADPELAPLRAESLEGVAPAVVVVVHHDSFRDEDLAYAARLEGAGVPVEVLRADDQMHAFFNMVNVFDAADQYVVDLAARAVAAVSAA